jgi:hypothetical protein
MTSIGCAHIIVVADGDTGLLLVAQLRRMEVARITPVAPRLFCRRIGAALQERSAARRRRLRMLAGFAGRPARAFVELSKPTMH